MRSAAARRPSSAPRWEGPRNGPKNRPQSPSGVVPDSEAVSTTDFSVMRLWPMAFHSAAWIR